MINLRSNYFLIVLLFLSSCASKSFLYNSDTNEEDGLAIHGNFCGKNIPTIETKIIDKRIIMLESIEPIDKVDYACKQHDICYAKNGYYSESCDNELIDRVKLLGDSGSRNCRYIKLSIISYFKTVNPSYVQNENKTSDPLTKIYTPIEYVLNSATGILSGLGAAIVSADQNSDNKISLAEILASRKNKQQDPKETKKQKRYEICN